MTAPIYEYCISLYRGSKCVGCIITQDSEDARERSQLWCSHGEGHTTKIEQREKVQTEHRERIPENEYLTQNAMREMFR